MSDNAKQSIKYQGNVEAFEFLLTDKIQCEHCHEYVAAGHFAVTADLSNKAPQYIKNTLNVLSNNDLNHLKHRHSR